MATDTVYDCLILGGGPAGLAAGVYLGRYLRPTLILDHKKPMTRWHRPIAHNVLGYPAGIHRNQLLDWGRAHVAKYDCVTILRRTIQHLARDGEQFVLTDADGVAYRGRGLILANGIEYLLPDIPDVLDYAGISLWHCPECDGFKCIDREIVVIGNDKGSAELALGITVWTTKVSICTHGKPPAWDKEATGKLKVKGIRVYTSRILRIVGNREEGMLEGFNLEDNTELKAAGAFANEGCDTPDELVTQLPLEMHRNRWVKVDHRMRTNLPRCYAAGDIIANAQTQLSVAMGTGATAAIWLHKELLPEELCLTDRGW
jgi:thioredoxin reductase